MKSDVYIFFLHKTVIMTFNLDHINFLFQLRELNENVKIFELIILSNTNTHTRKDQMIRHKQKSEIIIRLIKSNKRGKTVLLYNVKL